MKKNLALTFALCTSALLMAGCGQKPAPTAPATTPAATTQATTAATTAAAAADTTAAASQAAADKTPVELTLWTVSRKQDDFSAQQEALFLKKYPWITLNKVVKEGDPGNEFYQAVAAGNAPDVVNVSFTMMDSYMSAGICEPLNAYADKWDEWKDFTKEYVDMVSLKGKTYGVPDTVAPMLFGYNKALFKAAGIAQPPKTWDEALADAKKINDPSKQVAGYATLAAEWTDWFFQYYVWQAGGDLTVKNPDGTATLTFTDPAVIKAAKYYQQLRKDGVLQSDLSLKFADLITNFGRGKIGMMPFAGDWVSQAVANGLDPDDIGLTLPPAGPSGSQATAIAGSCWVINAKTDQAKKDAAWEYIKFFTNKAYYKANYEDLATKGAPNPVIIPRNDVKVTDFYQFPAEYKDTLDQVKTVGRLEYYGKSDFSPYIDRAVQKILVDPNADPATEFKKAQDLCEKEALPAFNKAHKE